MNCAHKSYRARVGGARWRRREGRQKGKKQRGKMKTEEDRERKTVLRRKGKYVRKMKTPALKKKMYCKGEKKQRGIKTEKGDEATR